MPDVAIVCRLIFLSIALLLSYRAASAEMHVTAVDRLEVPAVAGSRSPSLAARDGQIVLSWIEPAGDGHRLRFSTLTDDRWSEAREVAAGDDWFVNWADFPSVVPIDSSLWAAHWLVRQPAGGFAYDIHLSLSTDGGATWSNPFMPHDDGTATEHGFVTLYPDHRGVGLVWLDGRKMSDAAHGGDADHGMTLRYASYAGNRQSGEDGELDHLVCDCCQTDVAITAAGAIAVYRNRTADEVRDIYVMRNIDDGEWQPAQPVADDGWIIDGCPVNGPAIAAEGAHVAIAWFTAANGVAKVRLARSRDSGASFSAGVDITDHEAWGRTGIALLPDDNVAVSWLCRTSGVMAQVCMRAVTSDNRLGPVQVISGEHSVPPMSVPQLMRYRETLIAAWTAEVDGRTAVQTAAIRLDDLPAQE